MKVIYTVDLDPGDSPEVRGRLSINKNRVGYGVVEAIRKAMEEALWIWSVEDRYKGFTDITYRQPHVGRITMRIEGPRDTYLEERYAEDKIARPAQYQPIDKVR